MSDFLMPSLGADMARATLVAWNVAPGDRVARGDILCEVDTDKGVIEVEVWETGVVRELVAQVGEDVAVGGVLARIDAAEEPHPEAPRAGEPRAGAPRAERPPDPSPPAPPAPPSPAAAPREVPADAPAEVRRLSEIPRPAAGPPPSPPRPRSTTRPSAAAHPNAAPPDAEHRVTPAARVAARALGVNPASVRGTGPGGAVTSTDIEAAHAAGMSPASEVPLPPGVPPTPPRATPVARRMAEVHGLDLADVEGTGPRRAVTRADLEPLLDSDASAPALPIGAGVQEGLPGAEEDRKARLREAIAAAMARSKREIPHYYLSETVDMGAAVAWVETWNAERPPGDRILLAALLAHAVAGAAREVPSMNGFFEGGAYRPASDIHLGIAISLHGGGVVTPALHHCQDRDVADIMVGLRDLVARARRGKLRASEMTGGTLTMTALGEMGVESVFGVIFPPQVAIVGFGGIRERPWAHEGLLGVRPLMSMTLAADHRVSDGITGARFLHAIRQRLEHPGSP